MRQLAEVINRPISINGIDLVLVPDLVGSVPVAEQHQYVELIPATNTCPTISVREMDIETIRENYPDLPVYGLWQTLVNSDLIAFRESLHLVKTNELDGYYLHCDLGRAEFSGIYEAGFFAADSSFDLDEANEINPPLTDLVVPDKEAKLAAELQTESRIKVRNSWKRLSMALVALVVLAVAIDFALDTFHLRQQNKIQTRAAMLENLRTGLDQLRTSRLSEVPNDIETVKRLAVIWATFPRIKTDNGNSFANDEFLFQLRDEGFDPAEKLAWLTSTYHPEGYWQLSFNKL